MYHHKNSDLRTKETLSLVQICIQDGIEHQCKKGDLELQQSTISPTEKKDSYNKTEFKLG